MINIDKFLRSDSAEIITVFGIQGSSQESTDYHKIEVLSLSELRIGDLICHKDKIDHVIESLEDKFFVINETSACIFNFGCEVWRKK